MQTILSFQSAVQNMSVYFFFVRDKRNCKYTEYDVIEFKAYCAMVVIIGNKLEQQFNLAICLANTIWGKTRQIDKLGW